MKRVVTRERRSERGGGREIPAPNGLKGAAYLAQRALDARLLAEENARANRYYGKGWEVSADEAAHIASEAGSPISPSSFAPPKGDRSLGDWSLDMSGSLEFEKTPRTKWQPINPDETLAMGASGPDTRGTGTSGFVAGYIDHNRS